MRVKKPVSKLAPIEAMEIDPWTEWPGQLNWCIQKILPPNFRAYAVCAGRVRLIGVTEKKTSECSVSHTIREKTKLLNRVRRIRGQIEAVERALDQEIGCADVLQLIAGARGAINGLMAEVMEDHVRAHLIDPAHKLDPQRAHAAEELIDVVRSYLK
jgi:DNA-binding FrmR family transcriptional regulator